MMQSHSWLGVFKTQMRLGGKSRFRSSALISRDLWALALLLSSPLSPPPHIFLFLYYFLLFHLLSPLIPHESFLFSIYPHSFSLVLGYLCFVHFLISMKHFESELERIISRTQQMSWDDLSHQLVVDPEKAAMKSSSTLIGSIKAHSIQANGYRCY